MCVYICYVCMKNEGKLELNVLLPEVRKIMRVHTFISKLYREINTYNSLCNFIMHDIIRCIAPS